MADAVKKTETRIETTVTLTLTQDEAEALAAVVGNVSGEREGTPRKHTDGIFWALSNAGVKSTGTGHASGLISGTLRFHKSSGDARRAGNTSGADLDTPNFLRKLGY